MPEFMQMPVLLIYLLKITRLLRIYMVRTGWFIPSMVNKNLVTDNYYDGIKLDHGVNLVQVDNNFCAGNKNGGITLLSGHKNAITNNTCQMNNPSGILLSECSENTISGNRLGMKCQRIECILFRQ